MKLETDIFVEAPPAVVFRFYSDLDHLRWVSAVRRREWCKAWGQRLKLDAGYVVEVRQGRHAIALNFQTIRLEAGRLVEDECMTFPVKGAIHQVSLEPDGSGTRIVDMNHWDPPWYARTMVAKNEEQQLGFFVERLANAKRVIDAAFQAKGVDAFSRGVATELRDLQIAPVIRDDER